MERKNFQNFPSHLVTKSPWPILVSFSLLNLTIGTVCSMHGISNGGFITKLGITITIGGIILWLRDVITEGVYLGDHTKLVQKGMNLGIILFIISEAFVFLSVFWAYFHSSLSPAIEIGGYWPPVGISALDALGVPLVNTILLLSSGATITYAHHSLLAKNRIGTVNGFIWTLILSILFTVLQVFEYSEAAFTFAHGIFGTCFYSSTGLHGIHVIVGTLFILIAFLRTIFYHFTSSHHVGLSLSLLYWHFVDIIWLFLYIAVYFWGGGF